MRERGASDIRLIHRHVDIGDLADVAGRVGQLWQTLLRDAGIAHLKLQSRNDGAEVGVAAALAVAIDCALNLTGSRLNRAERVRYGQLAVVVGMDAEVGAGNPLRQGCHNILDFMGQCAAVRIAHNEPIRARFACPSHNGCCILGIVLVAIKKMLGIKNDLKPLALQKGNGIADHGQILFQCSLQGGMHMEIP
ncbi:hypothetical protein D3C71_1328270 [compost metagenome]